MYLDTDIILAIVKPSDWLKDVVERKIKVLSDPKTSVFTLVEAEIVLNREVSRGLAVRVLDKVKERNIRLLPLTEKMLTKSVELLRKYPKLNIFDSIHIACAICEGEAILSTDSLFDEIEEIEKVDPRDQDA